MTLIDNYSKQVIVVFIKECPNIDDAFGCSGSISLVANRTVLTNWWFVLISYPPILPHLWNPMLAFAGPTEKKHYTRNRWPISWHNFGYFRTSSMWMFNCLTGPFAAPIVQSFAQDLRASSVPLFVSDSTKNSLNMCIQCYEQFNLFLLLLNTLTSLIIVPIAMLPI